MDNPSQNNGQVFDTQFPYVDQGSPRPTYPPPYTTVPQEQNTSTCTCTSGICRSIFVGRISTFWLGSLLLVSGAMSQAGAAVAFGYFAGLSKIGAGIWCGYMFMTGGAVAIAAGHHETRNMIIGTIVTSALAVVASIALLAITGTGLSNDNANGYSCYPWCDFYPYPQYCPCFYEDWKGTAIDANGTIVGAAALAFIAGLWILVVACKAIRRNPASFQEDVSVPAQSIANAVLRNFYEDIPHERQAYSGPIQHVQQPQQQPISLSHLPLNTAYQPTLSQVMHMPTSYSPLQTNPNQQVFQVPVQLLLNIPQPNAPEESRNQQMLSMPVQYLLQQQYQQQMPLNHLQHYNIAPSTFPPQEQEISAFTQADADDAATALES